MSLSAVPAEEGKSKPGPTVCGSVRFLTRPHVFRAVRTAEQQDDFLASEPAGHYMSATF